MASGQSSRDIVLKTRFDLKSSESFISELRNFLVNNDFGDPYAQTLDKPVKVDMAQALEEMPDDTQRWIRELQTALRFDLFESDYQLVIEKLSYSILDFNTELKTGNIHTDRVEFVTENYVRGLHLQAEKIVFEVLLKQTSSREPIKFKVELLGPEFIVSPELTAEIPMGWMTKIVPDNVLISLDSINIERIMEKVVKRPDLIDLNIKDMRMPNVSIKVGNKTIKFDQKKIKQFFVVRKEEMKKGILDLLNVRMNERFSNILKGKSQQLLIPRTFGFKSDISGGVDIQKMEMNRTGIIQLDFKGHFCGAAPSFIADGCDEKRLASRMRREIDEATYQKSLREINRSLIEKGSNIALSVSEHYLNQLVEATIKAGLWDEALKDSDFELGPEKAFVLADERGPNFSLYLDIIYKLKGSQRILVGRSELRFPVKFKIAVSIEEKDGYPHLLVGVKEIDTSSKLLIDGAPQYGLPSTVKNVRFRNKVLKAIMEQVNPYKNETLLDIEIKELKGTYLHQLEFFSDGLGRGTATMGFGKK